MHGAHPGPELEKSAAALRASLQAAGTQLLELQQERCYMIALAPGKCSTVPICD